MSISETHKHRDKVLPYCQGNGLDLGSAGDPISPTAIQVELPDNYCPLFKNDYPPQLRGDATNLVWFKDKCLDYVFSSHLIEDFGPERQHEIICEWCRVIKPGGYLVVLAPERHRWKAALNRGQPPNLAHKNEPVIGELSTHLTSEWEVICDELCEPGNELEYGLMFVARRAGGDKPKPYKPPKMYCNHEYHNSSVRGYLKCDKCDSYFSPYHEDPKLLYNETYWTHEAGRSTIAEQRDNVATKNKFIMEFVRGGEAALEIGCPPGSLLKLLKSEYETVVGNDVTDHWFKDVSEVAGNVELVAGFFPEVTKKYPAECFDLIVASDVFEHVKDGTAFVDECKRLLKPKGQLLLVSPVMLNDEVVNLRMFNVKEHIWYYSHKWFEKALSGCMFARWAAGHELVIWEKV